MRRLLHKPCRCGSAAGVAAEQGLRRNGRPLRRDKVLAYAFLVAQQLAAQRRREAALTKARTEGGFGRVAGTNPSHPLEHYAGEYEHPDYGCITVSHTHEGLRFAFRATDLPLAHFHYDRFDTPDDELRGRRRQLSGYRSRSHRAL